MGRHEDMLKKMEKGMARSYRFVWIAMLLTILFGCLFFLQQLSGNPRGPEAAEWMHIARTGVLDEYHGFLYGMYVRVFVAVQNRLGVPYFAFIYTIQLASLWAALVFFMGKLRGKHFLAVFGVFMPPVLKYCLQVSPFTFRCVLWLLMMGLFERLIRQTECNINHRLLYGLGLGLCYGISGCVAPEDFVINGLVLLYAFGIYLFHQKKRGIPVLAAFLLTATLCSCIQLSTAEPGIRGRMKLTTESLIWQRVAMGELGASYEKLPATFRQVVSYEEAVLADEQPVNLELFIGSAVDRAYGDSAGSVFNDTSKALLGAAWPRVVLRVFSEALQPLVEIAHSGFALDADSDIAAGLYSICYYLSLLGILVVGICRKEQTLRILPAMWMAVVICVCQAFWNVKGSDFRYVLPFLCTCLAFFGGRIALPEANGDFFKNKPRTIRMILMACAAAVLVALGVKGFALLNKPDFSSLSGKHTICFGDSIWGLVQDETGVAGLLEKETGMTVTNYAIPGTTATHTGLETEVEPCLQSICGNIEDYRKALEQADYVILAYGMNDYYSGVAVNGAHSYQRALEQAVSLLQQYTSGQIVLIGQTYCVRFSDGVVVGDSNSVTYGGGYGAEYAEAARKVAEKFGCIFFNAYDALPTNQYNQSRYLEDATHLTERGRQIYARKLAESLIAK